MALLECDRFHGNSNFYDGEPPCEIYQDVLYLPIISSEPRNNRSFGLFDQKGRLIEAAGKFRGPGRDVVGPKLSTTIAPKDISNYADAEVFYMGTFSPHYGHFLIDTLCRMWAWKRYNSPEIKILYHGEITPDKFFKIPAAASLFRALSLSQESFIKFDEPIILRRVIIPNPAFEELNFSYRVFANFFNEVGRFFINERQQPNDTPIYLTKMNLKSGVSHYVNEDQFVDRLSKAGVEIISPEMHTLEEQIRLFQTRTIMTGLIGSAFHTSIFVPSRKLLILNYRQVLWTNQILFDKANQNSSVFVYDSGTVINEGKTGSFGNNYRMQDPVQLAEDFLREIEAFRSRDLPLQAG